MPGTRTLALIAVIAALLVVPACSADEKRDENSHVDSSRDEGGEDRGEHDGEGGESGEESGRRLGKGEAWDETRNGAHLILAYDPASRSFKGTVQNKTAKPLSQVRVEVHLSNGVELGPTERTDLGPGEKMAVELPAADQTFTWWTTHPEHGSEEEHTGSEHRGEHGEKRGEHDGRRGEHGERRGEHDGRRGDHD